MVGGRTNRLFSFLGGFFGETFSFSLSFASGLFSTEHLPKYNNHVVSVQSNDAKSSLEETNISALLRLLRFAFGSPFSSSSGFLLRGAAFGLTSGATDVEATDAVGLAGCSTSSSFAAVWFGFAKKEKASAPDGRTVRRELRYGAGQGDGDTHLRRQLRHPKEKVSQLDRKSVV